MEEDVFRKGMKKRIEILSEYESVSSDDFIVELWGKIALKRQKLDDVCDCLMQLLAYIFVKFIKC